MRETTRETKVIPIVTCFVFYEGHLLLLRRSRLLKLYPGKWSAVSGHLEPGLDPLGQAYMEIEEELGLLPEDIELKKAGRPLKVSDNHQAVVWMVYPFAFRVINNGSISLNWENEEFVWIDPEKVTGFDTVPGLGKALRQFLDADGMVSFSGY